MKIVAAESRLLASTENSKPASREHFLVESAYTSMGEKERI